MVTTNVPISRRCVAKSEVAEGPFPRVPRFISALLLLFASAFSAYATAAALFSQRSILVPLMIQGAMRNEMDPNQQGFAQVLAFAMIIVVALVMMLSHAVEKKAGQWQ